MVHLPILRHGVPYRSVDVATVVNHRTRQPFVRVSQANTGLIRRDLLKQDDADQKDAHDDVDGEDYVEENLHCVATFRGRGHEGGAKFGAEEGT